jgi:hypothetical protein
MSQCQDNVGVRAKHQRGSLGKKARHVPSRRTQRLCQVERQITDTAFVGQSKRNAFHG